MTLLMQRSGGGVSLNKILYFTFLQVAVLNAVLLASEESDVTLFRIFLPFIMAVFLLQNKKQALVFLGVCALFVFFQTVSWLISGYPLTYVQFAFSAHYLTMVFLFLLAKKILEDYGPSMFRFLYTNQVLLLLALTAQFFFGLSLPNVPVRDNGLNGWYWNHNDTSLALASFVMLSIYKGRMKVDVLINTWAIGIIMYNVSRGAVAGVVIFSVLLFVHKVFSNEGKKTFFSWLSMLFFLLSGVLCLAVLYQPVTERILYVLSMIGSIFRLEINPHVLGSDQVRVMAMIYALHEMLSSFFMGIGAGNSILMLASGKYHVIEEIKSIHNMPVQMLLELGAVLFFLVLISLKRVSGKTWGLLLVVLTGYLFCSLTQSGGFIVNYFAYLCFLVCLFDPKGKVNPMSSTGEMVKANDRSTKCV